jgi:hypothetical protein
MKFQDVFSFILITASLISCSGRSGQIIPTTNLENEASIRLFPTVSTIPNTTDTPPEFASESINYAFPSSINPEKQYLFYLHGKIIEDQGIPAISLEFGEYQYEAILEKLSSFGFVVISEQRPENTDGIVYARKVVQQMTDLLEAGVPASNITVVGASKGAGIVIYASHFLENDEVNYVIMAICHPDVVADLKQDQIFLRGNVLSIYDSTDEWAGSCQGLFSFSESEGDGLSSYHEVVLKVGTGHGILYQPLDEWVLPAVQWANKHYP